MLGKTVMACLSLSHGNADAERSFSANKNTVTAARARLGDRTINGIRLVKDSMRCHASGKAANVIITPALLRSARASYVLYKKQLEEDRKNEEVMKREKLAVKQRKELEEAQKREVEKVKEAKRKTLEMLTKQESDINVAEKEQRNILRGSGKLLEEAEGKLKDAIKAGNIDQISVAHGLLEVARKRMDLATGELSTLAAKRKTCSQKIRSHDEKEAGEPVAKKKHC
jgi:hypothetical protein